ncbi:lisH domain and HEAT repeat-containing protein KIAA1468-like isoform X2 [Zootermopsis nevadensis]|uniref:lisH domain and HEAT repeat-containing protein KIAA1468-like isoform X2 n=1 Tax=Zootermopsis nevadensis TaxID=136037 RepID=UPI000B8E4D22|nr:lisH domain and HEAT repeat-containing protein KIAA1468-like isoform X2 [Zootermopsis nevadensis]
MAKLVEDANKKNDYFTKVPVTSEISYADIATKLINENLLLTALELHTELVEAGREIPKLRDFFSNPGNFEHQAAPRLEISPSIQSEVAAPDAGSVKPINNEPIKPHEQRALNFLVNEYLLLHGYKLTSITFADENENQDFEDWDDVGLNIPKPAELLSLYRDFMRQSGHVRLPCQHIASQTDWLAEDLKKDAEMQELMIEMEHLKEDINALEQEKQEFKRLWMHENRLTAGEIVSSVTTPGSELVGMVIGETVSMHSTTPEHFELIEAEGRNMDENEVQIQGEDDGSALSLTDTDTEWTRVMLPPVVDGDSIPVDSSQSAHKFAHPHVFCSPDSRPIPDAFRREVLARCFVNISQKQDGHLIEEMLNDGISEERLVYILGRSLPRIIPNVILNKREELVPLIICTIHLHPEASKRDVLLHLLFNLKKRPQEDERRMILAGIVGIARCSGLSLVENEILPQCWEQISHKHVERRLLVAESCSALAPYVSSPIRNSLMLSMLQQMLLEDKDNTVKEAVVHSLALIVTFMDDKDKYFQCEELAMATLEDMSASVVESATRVLFPVLAKWAFDLGQLQSHLLTRLLQKLKSQIKAFVPESSGSLSHKKSSYSDQRPAWTVTVLQTLVPYVVMFVAAVDTVLSRISSTKPIVNRQEFSVLGHGLTNPSVFYEGEYDIGLILASFESYVGQEWFEEWAEMEWTCHTLFPDLLNILKGVELSQELLVSSFIKLFRTLCSGFGKSFTRQKVIPLFTERLQNLEQCLTDIGQGAGWPSLSIVPVYLIAVVASVQDAEANEELCTQLKRFLCALPLCGSPLDCLDMSVRSLCKEPVHQDAVLTALWEGVVHPRPVVRSAAASLFVATVDSLSEALVASRVAPALVTLASDPELSVRSATIPAFGTLITNTAMKEVQSKTYMQIQSFLSDPVTRENHSMLLQLVSTMGRIISACEAWFREEVILPQLAAIAAYAMQMSNQTRKLDLAVALVEAFSAAIYCTISKQTISTALLPGLRYVESISSQSLPSYHNTVQAMIKGAESRIEVQRSPERSGSISLAMATVSVEDVKQRVSKMFQNKHAVNRPANLPNIPGIFRKK